MSNNEEKKIIINTCHTCRTAIYEGEPIYGSSRGQTAGYTSGAYGGGRNFGTYGGYHTGSHAGESWAQCAWCYDQWQAEIAANRSFWWKWWLGSILVVIIATIVTIAMVPGLESIEKPGSTNPSQSVPWYRIKIFDLGSYKIPLVVPIVFFVSFILVQILGNFLQPTINRYRLRKRPIKL